MNFTYGLFGYQLLNGLSPIVDGRLYPFGSTILRRANGLSYIEPPSYRHTDGDMVPAIVLPKELEDAVARAVLEQAGAASFVTRPVAA